MAVVAIGLAAVALERSGSSVGEVVGERARQFFRKGSEQSDLVTRQDLEAVREEMALWQARARLLAHKGRLASQSGYEEALDEVRQLRLELARVYADAAAQGKKKWRRLDAELARLEEQLSEGSAEVATRLESVLSAIRDSLADAGERARD